MFASLQQRSGETVKVHQLDVAIPLQLKSQLKKGVGGQACITEGDSDSDTMPFVMLTRKGNKQQVTTQSKPCFRAFTADQIRERRGFENDGRPLVLAAGSLCLTGQRLCLYFQFCAKQRRIFKKLTKFKCELSMSSFPFVLL